MQTHQYAHYKLEIDSKQDSRNTKVSIFLGKYFFGSHVVVLLETFPLVYQLLLY